MQLFKLKTRLSEFNSFADFAKEFNLKKEDLIITNEFLYNPYMRVLNLPCRFIMQEQYGMGEPSDEMINHILADIQLENYTRVIAVGGGTVIDISKLFTLRGIVNATDAFERKIPIEKARQLVILPTTCGTGSEVTNISIAEIKSRCRWCVIVSHGGEEFTSLPSPYTRDRYLKFLELGADVVVAHHPHVPENYELFDNGKAIFYSLGNFIFDTDYQRVHLYTDVGVLLKLIFTEEAIDFEAIGIRIIRGDERIDIAPLPAIFTDIPAAEYELLAPLSAKAFVAEDRKKMIYLEPERFTDASEDVWNGYFFSTEPDGYFEGAHMDFHIIVPFSEKAEEGAWKKSTLEPVKEYILRQL